MGTPLREILEEHAGGMRDGVRFRGVLPGGASTDFLVERAPRRADGLRVGAEGRQPPGHRHDDRARRSDLPGRHGAQSRATSSRRSRAAGARRAGTGCTGSADMLARSGGGRRRDRRSRDRSSTHTRLLGPGHTFCALAPGAAEPLQSALKYFRDDFERHIREQRCPWRLSDGDDLSSTTSRTRSPDGDEPARTPASRSGSTCPISAGIRRWDRSARAGSARSSSSATSRTRAASS